MGETAQQTPWRAQQRDMDGVCIIGEREGVSPGGTPTNGLVAVAVRRFGERKEVWEANAALIVRAVNAHDALVAALKEADDVLEDRRITEFGRPDMPVVEALAKIRAALKLSGEI